MKSLEFEPDLGGDYVDLDSTDFPPFTATTPPIPRTTSDKNPQPHPQQTNAKMSAAERAPIVETVLDDMDDEAYTGEKPASKQFTIWCCPQDSDTAVSWMFTALVILVSIVVMLAMAAAEGFHLVIFSVLAVLVSLLAAFAWFVRTVLIQHQEEQRLGGSKKKSIHPLIDAAVDMIVKEYQLFQEDWNEQILLLKDTPENDDLGDEIEGGKQRRFRAPWRKNKDGSSPSKKSKTKDDSNRQPRSRVFRVLVQPFAPLLSRRRRRQQQKQAKTAAPEEASGKTNQRYGSVV